MKKKTARLIKKIKVNIRAIVFSAIVFMLLLLLDFVASLNNLQIYVVVIIAGLALLALELFLSWGIARKAQKMWKMPSLSSRSWREHFVHHGLLPSMLFLFTAMFIWTNSIGGFVEIFSFFVALLFIPLFINLHATYRNQFKLRKETNYIFDIIRIVIFFLGTDFIISLDFLSIENPAIIYSLLISLLSFSLITLMLWLQKQLGLNAFLLSLISAIFMGAISLIIILFVVLAPVIVTLFITISFFLLMTYWHHKIEGTFDIYVFSEYLLLAFIAIILLISLKR